MKAGLVTSAVRRNGCAAYAIRLGKIRLLMTPYGAGKGRLFAQMSPGLRPRKPKWRIARRGLAKCGCARHVGALAHVRLVMRDAWLARVQPALGCDSGQRTATSVRSKCPWAPRTSRCMHSDTLSASISVCVLNGSIGSVVAARVSAWPFNARLGNSLPSLSSSVNASAAAGEKSCNNELRRTSHLWEAGEWNGPIQYATCSALRRRLERAGPRRLTFSFAQFRRTDWELPERAYEPSQLVRRECVKDPICNMRALSYARTSGGAAIRVSSSPSRSSGAALIWSC